MNVSFSEFLKSKKPMLKELVALLSKTFDYVSVLGTDVKGKSYGVRDKSSSVSDYWLNERGFVARIYKDGRYYEYSFNEITESNISNLVNKICAFATDAADVTCDTIYYPLIEEEEITESFMGEAAPYSLNSGEILERLRLINNKAHDFSNLLVDVNVLLTTTKVSKIFLSNKKDLEQSYIWSEGYVLAVVRREGVTKSAYESYSGLKGPEVLDELSDKTQNVVSKAVLLLDAKSCPPGEYDVICSPDAAGIIAHEAFGHGVEMDMFVKNRAKSMEYLEKPVASSVVTMRDGARSANHVSSYLFDDEGTLGTDTVIIKDGYLKTGISDILSALKLGTRPTGNGKRESFKRKAYARMTNTFFEPGTDKLEDMILSIKHGYLINDAESGMEDPKDWGIQVMFESAEEIIDGKLTGNIVSPVIMTGYVPDLLSDITMVSGDFKLSGSGCCGKGYKEFVKVSSGGPYIKTKARLG